MSEIIPHQQTLPDIPAPSAVTSPDHLISVAVQQGADSGTIRDLIALRRELSADQAREAFLSAKARLDLPVIAKRKPVKDRGGKVMYKHATLGDIIDQLTPHLRPNGFKLSYETPEPLIAGNVRVTAVLSHEQGHREETSMEGPPDTGMNRNSLQAIGSTFTYLARYTATALLGLAISDEEDTDGAAPPAAPSDELLATAQDVAEQGTEALRDWYKAQSAADRTALKPALPRLKERAAEVLREADSE